MTDTPPDWVLAEAAKRSGLKAPQALLADLYYNATGPSSFRVLCDMILKHEQPPVDRKLLCAREACAHMEQEQCNSGSPGYVDISPEETAVRAIELWEEGFGQ